jgi:hypothetical protein
MLARSTQLRHHSTGVELTTPLLIPSFSSKGFARNKKGVSEIGRILEASGEFITETYLLSAYDIHYGDIPDARNLPFTPELIVLDSGGYEKSLDKDYSAVVDSLPAPNPWEIGQWEHVIAEWPDEIAMLAVSYDCHNNRFPFMEQVATARRSFARCRGHLNSFLLKPETTTQLTLDEVFKTALANAGEFRSFDVVGVTEKELGRTMLKRMAAIAKLRCALDEAGVNAPIHIFGALDPVAVCFYFIAGAEIFDGLTWIRYGYLNDLCVYTHNVGAVKYGLDMRDDMVKTRAMTENLYALQGLQRRLKDFVTTQDFSKLAPHAELLRDGYDSLRTQLKGRI